MTYRILAAFALLDFIALNVWAFYSAGLDGLWEWIVNAHNAWHWVVVADLMIALSICVGLMWADARRRGGKPIAETFLTFLGSVGPLVYLMRRRKA